MWQNEVPSQIIPGTVVFLELSADLARNNNGIVNVRVHPPILTSSYSLIYVSGMAAAGFLVWECLGSCLVLEQRSSDKGDVLCFLSHSGFFSVRALLCFVLGMNLEDVEQLLISLCGA